MKTAHNLYSDVYYKEIINNSASCIYTQIKEAAEQSEGWFAGISNQLLPDCILKVDNDDDDDWKLPSTFNMHSNSTDTGHSIRSVQFFRFIIS
jgi:hypothetical protein